ncbi:MAG: D-alanyl-D-alanine carboxypeptidase, partial [Holdemanella sp.]|nr:D-alanyl-D-alanine carboxypeptidase [Holdemanella sp.]
MKKLSLLCISFFVFVLTLFPVPVYASEKVDLNAGYAYVIDTTSKRVFYSKDGDKEIYPASMTKVVTCIVALEAIKDINETVTIDASDLDGLVEANASVAGFYEGEQVTYKDLLYGSLLPSGADASNALARLTYGDVKAFVGKMNELCTKLGLENTHFVNPTGLHSNNHYTTCKEMAELVKYAYLNKTFRDIYGTVEYTSTNGIHTWLNTLYTAALNNNLEYDFILGAKTGYTDLALNCVASVITSNDHEIISILAYDEERVNLLVDLKSIQTYLDSKYITFDPESVVDQRRFKYHFDKIDIYRQKEKALYLPKDFDKELLKYEFDDTVDKTPIKKNAVVGTYII